MDQGWTVSAVLRKERWSKDPYPLDRILLSSSPRELVWLLAKPTRPQQQLTINADANILDAVANSRLANLPPELLDQILGYLDAPDLQHASFTSQYFWNVCYEQFLKRFMAGLGSWAGESLVCLGSNCDGEDTWGPPGMLTPQEVKELCSTQKTLPNERLTLFEMLIRGRTPGTLSNCIYDFAPARCFDENDKYELRMQYDELVSSLPENLELDWIDQHPEAAGLFLSGNDWYRVHNLYPQNEKHILRNLTTKEYVRAEAIAIDPSRVSGPYIDGIGFGEVVLSRICWSSEEQWFSDEYDWGRYEGDIHRGVWAGHAFDITTVSRHMEEAKEEWTDVSDEVAREIAALWEFSLGEHWRDEVMKRAFILENDFYY
ncbi:hypothetical protein NA57DRAFT_79085 [Rhizodiscina lignyota]|uniref:F-box domain-containing protein n=1 Tax=Rhizodiscina lignyota TaxID=1504668 RepID=A0A9P4IBR3_9PEZI|nr:hypothetical protein NA57DRAFT_79085 [Rhizodiscina lignyota]